MNTRMTRIAGMTVLALGLVLVSFSKPAAAAHSGGTIGVQFGGGGYGGYHAPAYERRMTSGHYEIRRETVLVEPEHHERRWVPARYETRCDAHGCHYQALVSEGYYQSVCVPARYETREVRVWVPGYCQEVPVTTQRYDYNDRPRFSLRGFWGF